MTNPLMILIFAAVATVTSDAPVQVPATAASFEQCLNSVSQKPFDDRVCLEALVQAGPDTADTPAIGFTTNLETNPAKARAHSALAAGYAMSNRLVAADEHLQIALRLAPDDWHTLANTSVVDLYSGRFEQAYVALSGAMAANPDFPPYLFLNRSLALRGLGRFPESARDVSEYRLLMGLAQPGARPCEINSPECRSVQDVGPRLTR